MAVWNVIDHTEISGSSTTTWNPTSISGSYDHLYIEISARSDRSGASLDSLWLRFNGDTGANYSSLGLEAGSSSVGSNKNSGATKIERLYIPSDGRVTDTDIFGAIKIWIPNYANTSNYKQTLGHAVVANMSITAWQWIIVPSAGLWDNTAAITSISMFPQNGDNLKEYSTFTLYGINGAA
jgi:hypothetical protein